MTRLSPPFGTRIDRARSLRFTFEGEQLAGYYGDRIASALAANGHWMLSRSFKYHRPRGAFTFAGTEANTLVQVGDNPNVPADLALLEQGMEITAQNVAGSLKRDRDAVLDKLGQFLPVGFYYRTFMGPTKNAWLKFWEPMIRKKAGLGVIPMDAAHWFSDKQTLHCDVAVIGSGAAGVAAAREAAAQGEDVVLVDDQPVPAPKGLAEAGVRVMQNTTCSGLFEDNWLGLISGPTLTRMRASRVIFATGTIEQPAVFRNNDLPGIISAGGALRLMQDYGVTLGQNVAVYAADPAADEVIAALGAAGVSIACVIAPEGTHVVTDADILRGYVTEACGKQHITGVKAGGEWVDCDTLIVAAGSVPAWHMRCQTGAMFRFDPAAGVYGFHGLPDTVRLAGSVAGHADEAASGRAAAHGTAYDGPSVIHASPLPLTPHPKGRDFVDVDEDLQIKDIQNAVKEGYAEIELVKRFTTVGMGPSQGRHPAVATARLVAEATGRDMDRLGVTTARPPTAPETLGALAGPHHVSERRTALHGEHIKAGAEMRPVGAWWRPYLYGAGNRTDRITAEVKAVREGVGVLDVSTLGKLGVRGPDAGAFLDRIYTMAHAKQPVGKVRYCLMLNEMGTVIDDGVAFRLAEDRFYVTATTGAVGRVYADMAFWNAQWRMDVDVVNLTAGMMGLNITGPQARAVVEALESDFDRDAFPYLTGRSGLVAGVPVHAMRIGFTGELSFDLHAPASRAHELWAAVMAAGAPVGLVPYGLEASRILRLEKGHILIGQDTDALTSPDELGFGWAVSKKKPFFIGKRALEMRRNLGLTRRLAALRFDGGETPGESCLVMDGGKPFGHMTSVLHSPTLGHAIALAYVRPEDAEPGGTVAIRARGGAMATGHVCDHAFYDAENARQDL